MIDAIIFDMDGTLIDMVDEVTDAWNITFKNHGMDKVLSKDDIKGIMGLTPPEIAKVFFPNYDLIEGTKLVNIACEEEVDYFFQGHKGKTYIPNEQFLIELSKKYKLYIVSNCQKGYIECFYKNFNYGKYFIDFANAANGKSKADNIKAIKEKHNLVNPVYVGDTLKDELSAKEANVKFVFAEYGYGKSSSTNKISRLEEIINVGD